MSAGGSRDRPPWKQLRKAPAFFHQSGKDGEAVRRLLIFLLSLRLNNGENCSHRREQNKRQNEEAGELGGDEDLKEPKLRSRWWWCFFFLRSLSLARSSSLSLPLSRSRKLTE